MSTRARVICHGSSETNARRLEEEAKGWSWRVLFSSRLFQSWWESKNRFFGLTTVFWPRCSNFRHHFQLSVADRFLSTTLFVVACTEHPENQRQRFVYRFSSTSNRDASYVDQDWKRKEDVSKKCSNYRPTFVKIQMWTQLFRLIFRFVVTSVIPWLGNYRRHASFHATATKPFLSKLSFSLCRFFEQRCCGCAFQRNRCNVTGTLFVMQVYPFVHRISNVKPSINLLRGVNSLLLIIHYDRIPIILNWMLNVQ